MIYQPDVSRYWVVHLRDSIYGSTVEKPITIKEQITLAAPSIIPSMKP